MWEILPPPARARYLRRLLTNITSIGGKSVDPYSDKKRERAQSGRSSMYYGLSDVCLTFLSTLTGRPDYVTSLVHQCGKFLPFSCVVQVHLKGGPIWPRQHRQKNAQRCTCINGSNARGKVHASYRSGDTKYNILVHLHT